MYRSIVEQLAIYAVRNEIRSFIRLKALKYREMRSRYLQLPSHYVYTACQDAMTRAKSFLRLKKRKSTNREYPEVRKISIWLDDHLWRTRGYMEVSVATHKGRISVELEPHKQYWRYINGGWSLGSEAKIKLDYEEKRIVFYLVFHRDVEPYEPESYLPVDVNENNVTVLMGRDAYLFETRIKEDTLGYYYRRKSIQRRYDQAYGVNAKAKLKALRGLREKKKKQDVRQKIANIIAREARRHKSAIILEKLGKKVNERMIRGIKDKQLRHRIFQAAFRGMQSAIEEKARELGVPIVYVNPKNTSKMCPVHRKPIKYSDNSRIGRCSLGGELWHRDVVAVWNLLFRALEGNGSNAPSFRGQPLDGGCVPFTPTATYEPIRISKSLWARWKSLPPIRIDTILNRMKR